MNRLMIKRIRAKYYWFAKDVRGVTCGKSQKGFSSSAACQHNASVTQAGLTQGLKAIGYDR